MADLTPHRRGLARKCEARLRSSSYGGQPSRSLFSRAYAPWASARQPSLAARDYLSGLPSRSSRQLRPPSPFGLRRGSLHSLRERRWLAKPKLAAASPAFALWASARQPSLATRATMACQAEARGSLARLRPLGFGAAAFTRYASDDGLPSRSSRQPRPPSPFGLRRGSLHSLRERRWLAKPKLAAASPAFALWASARQPSLAARAKAGGARLHSPIIQGCPPLFAKATAKQRVTW